MKGARCRLPAFVLLALIIAACGGSAAESPSGQVVAEAPTIEYSDAGTPLIDPFKYAGEVVTAGSSTVFPLAERMAERFQDEGFAGHITIDSIGSGAGFERFCVSGEIDVANASRPIKPGEIESCNAIGRHPIEFRVGTDALAVAVSAENDFLADVTLEELALIFGGATTWADVRPEWPAEEIQRFIPGTDSGTFDFFIEAVFGKDETSILTAGNTQFSEDDNVLVQGILGSPYAIGFFGYAYYRENADTLKILAIEGVEATAASVDANTYPLGRPLFIYSDADIMHRKPQVAAYINFFFSFAGEEVIEVGYFPISPAALGDARTVWLDATLQ